MCRKAPVASSFCHTGSKPFFSGAIMTPLPLQAEGVREQPYALLDPLEITVPNPADCTPGQKVVHHRWFGERLEILTALRACEKHRALYARIHACGTNAAVQWSPARNRFRLVGKACRSSLCPRCRAAKAAKLVDRIKFAVAGTPRNTWKLLTLTIRSSPQPLAEQAKRVKQAFRRLRQSSLFKLNCSAGAAILEVTYNATTRHWHPHLHCLLRATFIPQQQISHLWAKLTRGSPIVDIRSVKDAHRAAAYIAAYLAKPPAQMAELPPDMRAQWIDANCSQHWLVQWGQALPPAKGMLIDELPNDWYHVGWLEYVVAHVPDFADQARESPLQLLHHLTEAEYESDEHERPP